MVLTILYVAVTVFFGSPFGSTAFFSGESEGLSDLLHCVMVLWPYFIILTIFFAEGLKKRNTLATVTEAPLMQEVESSAGLAPTTNSTVPDASETSPVATSSEPLVPLASPSLPTPAEGNAPATSMPQYEANAFAWPVPIDEAPPEYSLPQRPLAHLEIPPRNPNIASRNTDENEDPELPDHNDAMGLNHQADGLRPRRNSLPEDWKHGMKKN